MLPASILSGLDHLLVLDLFRVVIGAVVKMMTMFECCDFRTCITDNLGLEVHRLCFRVGRFRCLLKQRRGQVPGNGNSSHVYALACAVVFSSAWRATG